MEERLIGVVDAVVLAVVVVVPCGDGIGWPSGQFWDGWWSNRRRERGSGQKRTHVTGWWRLGNWDADKRADWNDRRENWNGRMTIVCDCLWGKLAFRMRNNCCGLMRNGSEWRKGTSVFRTKED